MEASIDREGVIVGGEAPVRQVTLPDGTTAWVVSRYDDVRAGLADPRLSLDKRNAKDWRGLSLPPALDANLLNMDPPDHDRLRRLIGQVFTPRRVAALRPKVQRLADRLIDAIEPDRSAELVARYAVPLSATVLCDLLGVPEDGREELRSWIVGLSGSAGERSAAVDALSGYLTRLLAAKRGRRGDDLLSALVAAPGEHTMDELVSLAFLLIGAGFENAANLVSGGILVLLRHPEQLVAVRRNPAAVEPAVEELLRFDPPAPVAIRRFPTEDVAIGGVTIPAGAPVLLSIADANHDPGRFHAPDRLDIRRTDQAHLSFGYGIHYCVGAPLARVAATIGIGTLLRRLPGLALAVPPDELRWRPSFRVRGLVELPVRW
jgi:cytochrome P450